MDVEWRIESLKTFKIIFQLFANLLIFGLIISIYGISQKKGVLSFVKCFLCNFRHIM